MNTIYLDTETSGMSVENGCVVIEIGAVEYDENDNLVDTFHVLLNPSGGTWEDGVEKVHGHSLSSLVNCPTFKMVAQNFVKFITNKKIVIHNAPFDVGFLNMELKKVGLKNLESYVEKIEDSLIRAKSIRPKKKNNLNALCDEFEVNRENRTFHGALMDAELLAAVYPRLIKNAKPMIDDLEVSKRPRGQVVRVENRIGRQPIKISDFDLEQHKNWIKDAELKGKKEMLWNGKKRSQSNSL